MCGIFAYSGKEKVDIKSCLLCLNHRGPDYTGILEEKKGKIALGHCRLSIIDVGDRGNQPMTSTSGRSTIVFNGEIYNYQELRDDLVSKGATLKTESDTEVILAGYEMFGVEFFERFRGMWSFVIYDRIKEKFVVSRDPLGIKPLIYAIRNESIYFVSEIKCLRGQISLEPNSEAYPIFYNLGYFIAPFTPYKNVWKIRPGEIMSWDIKEKKMSVVGRVSRFAGESKNIGSFEEAVEILDKSLYESVQAHYVSDVPVSILLSGGNDSSLIAALSKKLGKSPVAYHVAVAGSSDTFYAKAVSKHLGLDLVIEQLDQAALESQFEKVWSLLDEPTADISIVPTSLVYEKIKGKAKVVLSGEGGDELFGGYLRHNMLLKHSNVSKRSAINLVLNKLLLASPVAITKWNPLVQRLRGALLEKGICNDLIGAYLRGVRIIDYPLEDTIMRNSLYELYKSEYDARIPAPFIFDLISYLPNDLLSKSDIASMASSVEARVPFVDRYLVNDAFEASMAGGREIIGQKKILKEVLLRYLPEDLVFRSKQGFGVPIHSYNSNAFNSDFKKACAFHLENKEAFAVSPEMACLIESNSAQEAISRKFPRFAFALISNWRYFML